jgi:hypothetical protein
MTGLGEQSLISDNREIERGGVIFLSRKADSVIGERGARELVLWEGATHLAPALDARS